MKRNSQAGFAHITVILVILLVIGVVAFAGYRVMQAQSPADENVTTSSSDADKTPATTQKTIDSKAELKASDEALTQTSSDLNSSLDTASLDSDINSLY